MIVQLKEGRGVGSIRKKNFIYSVKLYDLKPPKHSGEKGPTCLIDLRCYRTKNGESDYAIAWAEDHRQEKAVFGRGVSERCLYTRDAVVEALHDAGIGVGRNFDYTYGLDWIKVFTAMTGRTDNCLVVLSYP